MLGRSQFDGLFGSADPDDLAREHDVVLVVTAGADGWDLSIPDGARQYGDAFDVAVRDVTGAGDCFFGSYAAGLERGEIPARAARSAAAAAGLSCTVPGARAGMPGRAELDRRLSSVPPLVHATTTEPSRELREEAR